MSFAASEKIKIARFLEMAENNPVIDVRSPSEFLTGHIPGAFNIPLFDDVQREAVGIAYNNEGRLSAILKGLELAGPGFSRKLDEAHKIAAGGKILVHCWRGGMRSETMAWLFSLGDIRAEILEGGYKSYRHYILDFIPLPRKYIILGGMTGSSKTHILRHIKGTGHQVVDLEALANHRGSAFGALGQPPQPTTEHFANLLFDELKKMDEKRPIWLEDESRNIGTVFMPDSFYSNIQKSPTIIIRLERKKRLPRLIEEYSEYPPEMLKSIVLKIRKRLGGDKTSEALKAIETGDFVTATDLILSYYDKTYEYGISGKGMSNLKYVDTDTDNIEQNAMKILKEAEKIKW